MRTLSQVFLFVVFAGAFLGGLMLCAEVGGAAGLPVIVAAILGLMAVDACNDLHSIAVGQRELLAGIRKLAETQAREESGPDLGDWQDQHIALSETEARAASAGGSHAAGQGAKAAKSRPLPAAHRSPPTAQADDFDAAIAADLAGAAKRPPLR
ncbi:MAG TPA: hypothetical protein DCX12_01070 [Chloroflexi bacterium]|jgi:hypothetical protein|nr:hypothetical protein [Chloroflexota bacterium]